MAELEEGERMFHLLGVEQKRGTEIGNTMEAEITIDDVGYAEALRRPGLRLPLSDAYQARLNKLCVRPSRRNQLWEIYIQPSLLLDELNHHVPIHERADDDFSDQQSRTAFHLVASGEFVQGGFSLFSNPLHWPAYGPGFPRSDPRWYHKWEPPSQRAVIGSFWVFTFEWDSNLPHALQTQFDWVWKRDTDGLTALERLDQFLREHFKDYRGFTVVWSGKKSVHIHLVFDPSHLSKATIEGLAKLAGKSAEAKIRDHWTGDIRQDAIWDYYRVKWWELQELVHDVSGVHVEFDDNLSTLFQKRRLPWGARIAEVDDFNGFDEGDPIPQVVLAERIQRTSPRSAIGYFLSSEEANRLPTKGPVRGRGGGLTVELDEKNTLDGLTEYLRKHWGREYPKPARLVEKDGEIYLYFFNHEADQRPSSYVREDHSGIVYRGKGAPTTYERVRSLPGGIRLLDLLFALVEEDEARGKIAKDECPSSRRPSTRHPAYSLFARSAEDRTLSGIRMGMSVGAWNLTTTCCRSIIVSTEGAGKSTALIRQALDFQLEDYIENFFGGQNLVDPTNGFHIVACLAHEQAEEQYERYRDWCQSNGEPANAILLKSFDQRYREYFARDAVPDDAEPITWTGSLDLGFNSQVDAVYQEQQVIYEEITKEKNDAWLIHGSVGEGPVNGFNRRLTALIFTTQKLAQEFNRPTKTRAWLHPDFDPRMERDEWRELALQFRAYRIIHDEIMLGDLLHIASDHDFDLALAFRELVEEVTGENWTNATWVAKRQCFKDYASRDLVDLGFHDVVEIIDAGFQPEHRQVVDFDKLRFGRDNHDEGLYRRKTGTGVYLKEKSWWFDTRARIAVTTTEAMVAEIAGQLRDKNGKKVFRVERWDGQQFFPADSIELIPDIRACKKRIQELVDDILADPDDPTEVVITDMAEGDQVYSHVSARGRNDLDDKNITTVLTFISGEEYAVLNAVAQKYDIKNLIELCYRDRLNQSAGRNRGLRSRSPEPLRHKLRLSPTLMRVLGGYGFFGKGRYLAYLTAA